MGWNSDRRVSFRLDVASRTVCYLTSGGVTISGPLRDISVDGLYVVTSEKPEIGTGYDIEIAIVGKHSQIVVGSMTGKITRIDDTGLVVGFDEKFEWFAMVPLYFHTVSAQQT